MNIKPIIIICLLAFAGLIGFNLYSSKKTDETIEQTQKISVASAHSTNNNESPKNKSTQSVTPVAEPAQSSEGYARADSNYSSNNSLSNNSNYQYMEKKYKKDIMASEMLMKIADTGENLAQLVGEGKNAKDLERDNILAKIRDLRVNTIAIDTQGNACATEAKNSMIAAIDSNNSALQVYYNNESNNDLIKSVTEIRTALNKTRVCLK